MAKGVKQSLPWWRALLIIVLATVLGLVLIAEAAKPFKRAVAVRYVSRGDSAFLALDFDAAQTEYSSALRYDPNAANAASREELAKEARTDIAAARPFFAEHHLDAVVARIDEATQNFTDPKAALTLGATLFTGGEYSYAQYSLQKAVALDPGYSEAWHYLAQDYDKLAAIDSSYEPKAKDAYAKRDALTSKYLAPQS